MSRQKTDKPVSMRRCFEISAVLHLLFMALLGLQSKELKLGNAPKGSEQQEGAASDEPVEVTLHNKKSKENRDGDDQSGHNRDSQHEDIVPKQNPVAEHDAKPQPEDPSSSGIEILPQKTDSELVECEGEHWYGGIGIYNRTIRNGWPVVADRVIPGYPGYRAGIQPGDLLTPLDSPDIKGPPGTSVTIQIIHNGQERIVQMIREKICTQTKNPVDSNLSP